MRILHISDTHVGHPNYFNELALYTIIKEIKEGNFDAVIHTGDVTQNGTVEEYRKAKDIFSNVKTPVIFMPGNHDARAGGLELFERFIGPLNGVTEIGDAVIIHVNSAFEDGNEGRVGMIKFNMIRDALNRFSDKPIKMVAMHHHIIPVPKSGRERNILQNAGDILDLIIKDDVDMVLAGHRHYPNLYRIENTVFLNAGTSSGTKTHWGDVNSRNIVDFFEGEQRIVTRRVERGDEVTRLPRRDKRVYSYFGKRILRAVQMSNTHISDTSAFLEVQFRNAMKWIEQLSPDIVVHCGGVVREGIPLYYDMADQLFSNSDVPIIFSPAGRDINYLGYHLFEQHFGPFEQEFTDGEVLFLGLYSPQYDSLSGVIGSSERKALRERLSQVEERTKIVFLHHNVLPIPHSREKGLLEDSGDVLRTLVDSDVDMVLTGTSSHPHAARVNDTIVVNAGSMSSPYQRSLFGNSFNLIDIYEGAIAISEVNSLWGHRRLLGIWDRRKAPAPFDRSF
jgi:predicted phosphodiesterase